MALATQNIEEYQSAEYIQRGPNTLKSIIQNHFNYLTSKYREKYDTKQGKLRLERIQEFVYSSLEKSLPLDYTKKTYLLIGLTNYM